MSIWLKQFWNIQEISNWTGQNKLRGTSAAHVTDSMLKSIDHTDIWSWVDLRVHMFSQQTDGQCSRQARKKKHVRIHTPLEEENDQGD